MKIKTTDTFPNHTQDVQDALLNTHSYFAAYGQYDDGRYIIPENHLFRPNGSFVTSSLARGQEIGRLSAAESYEFLSDLAWNNVTDIAIDLGCAMLDEPDTPKEELRDVKYYAARYNEATHLAYEAVMPLSEMSEDQIKEVRIQLSHHSGKDKNYELVANIRPRLTSIIHLITGNCINKDHTIGKVVYTWFPGQLTPPAADTITSKSIIKLRG